MNEIIQTARKLAAGGQLVEESGIRNADLFHRMTPIERQALCDNTALALKDALRHIQERYIADCTMVDPAYGAGVARSLGFLSQASAA